jgi:hypothetical protein
MPSDRSSCFSGHGVEDSRETMYTPTLLFKGSKEFLRPVNMIIRFEHNRQRPVAIGAPQIFNDVMPGDVVWIVNFPFFHVCQH